MSWLSITNLKLYQSQLLLQQWQSDQLPALQQALLNSALYHLHDAYLAYLHELAEAVSYRQPLTSLADLIASVTLVTGEMKELQALEQDGYSWLAQCLQCVQDSHQPIRAGVVHVQHEAPSNRIHVVDDPTANAARWHQALSDLIDQQRANRHES